jgi:hypothetical protein
LQLSGKERLAIQMKDDGKSYAYKIKFNGISHESKVITVQMENVQDGSCQPLKQIKLSFSNELEISLLKAQRIRYLWTIE